MSEKSLAEKFIALAIPKEEKARTSFFLSISHYENFKMLCKLKGITLSSLIDLLIKDITEKFTTDIEEFKKKKIK